MVNNPGSITLVALLYYIGDLYPSIGWGYIRFLSSL